MTVQMTPYHEIQIIAEILGVDHVRYLLSAPNSRILLENSRNGAWAANLLDEFELYARLLELTS